MRFELTTLTSVFQVLPLLAITVEKNLKWKNGPKFWSEVYQNFKLKIEARKSHMVPNKGGWQMISTILQKIEENAWNFLVTKMNPLCWGPFCQGRPPQWSISMTVPNLSRSLKGKFYNAIYWMYCKDFAFPRPRKNINSFDLNMKYSHCVRPRVGTEEVC